MWTSRTAGWHWFYYHGALMTSWMSESADEREWASDQSLAACPSQALKDAERTLASVMWLPGWGNLWRGQVWGVKHTQLGHNIQGKGKPSCVKHLAHKHPRTYTCCSHCAFSAHLSDSLMVMMVMLTVMLGEPQLQFRWLMSSVIFSAPSLHPPEAIWCPSPTPSASY